MSKVIKNVDELEILLSRIVKEAVVHATGDVGTLERRRQDHLSSKMTELEASEKQEEMEEVEEEDEATSPKAEEEEVEVSVDVEKPSDTEVATATTSDIFKTLNIMRSGKSLKDPGVKKSLMTYIEQLTTGEQQSLYAFLSGLAEMMVGGESGQAATDPGQAGIKVKPTEKTGEEEIDVGVKTVKTSDEKDKKEMPIVVGEAADKSTIRNRIRELWK